MYCTGCGKLHSSNDKFCASCGKRFETTGSAATNVAAAAAPALARTSSIQIEDFAGNLPPDLEKLRGVGGWLAWFCVILILLQPLKFFAEAADSKDSVTIILDLALAGLSITTGIFVANKKQSAFTWLKWYFGVIIGIAFLALFGTMGDTKDTGTAILGIARSSVAVIIWASYFKRSKRVLATFGRNL